MRISLSLSAVVVALVLAGAASAADHQAARDGRQAAVTEGPMSMPATEESLMPEPCWGDRFEKDEDLNEGSRISTEEILRVINPVQS